MVRHLEASAEVADGAFRTLEEDLTAARAELERERGWRITLQEVAQAAIHACASMDKGRGTTVDPYVVMETLKVLFSPTFREIQAAEREEEKQ